MNPWIYRGLIAIVFALLFYWLFPTSAPNPRPLWWDIQVHGNNPSAIGLEVSNTTLTQAFSILKKMPEVALFTKRQNKGEAEPYLHLEAYFDDVFDAGDRIILSLDAEDEFLQHIKKEAFQPRLFPNDVIRVQLSEAALKEAQHLTFKSMTIIVGWQVAFEDFKAHFGEPDQYIDDGQGNAHFLYSQLGLDFTQPADGLQLLQFVRTDTFKAALLEPLLKARENKQ